ncbi:rhamnan synthesis F family protein [Novilysobacter avium]|uniref:Uncharacterized protein n=1 Tax=Novilysobacter avium TaxID=2781023 RepID=A0A7S6UJX8_9GAMM|nr:rhamnan synthesis F family protein [Lysobacter avium]QOW21681.1 hypothetical protein INQ42_10655 [Lysobacter avium]
MRAMKRVVKAAIRRLGSGYRHPEMAAVDALGIFDRARYLDLYPDVKAAGVDPLRHYVDSGAREGRSPCDLFNGVYYLSKNPDVRKARLNPLLHFCESGWRESRNPSADFDVDRYVQAHFRADKTEENPLLHYLAEGRRRGLEAWPVLDPRVEAIQDAGVFDVEYYLEQYPDVLESGMDPLVHYVRHGARENRNPSALFDGAWYLRNNHDVARKKRNPLLHFCQYGWKQLRNPCRDFDVWWYWSTHMDPAVEGENPLGHYMRVGRELGLDTRPPARVNQYPASGYRHVAGQPVRRVCLFAAYDADGVVDDYVLAYLRELARHADIYYLADSEMPPEELDKLTPHVKQAWAERHGEYDFGSYSRLAKKLGWDLLAEYDELLLVNDSCYLLRSLDEVFERMDARACDWWGLQATKGLASTRKNPANQFRQPIPVETVRGALLDQYERDYHYDFHVASYFVAYRRPVTSDPEFRNLIDSVVAQDNKRNIILKYEVGLTRHLIARGYAFDTFMPYLYPFHPMFTTWYFHLLGEGFPLLKRYLLSENHYFVPGLWNWKERILEKLPGADVDIIQRNLDRVVDPDRLHRNLHIGTERLVDNLDQPRKLLGNGEFLAADRVTPKHATWWGFPVCAFSDVFSGNERAVFEQVRDDPLIRKIIFTLGRPVEVTGANVTVVPLKSPRGQHLLMRCGKTCSSSTAPPGIWCIRWPAICITLSIFGTASRSSASAMRLRTWCRSWTGLPWSTSAAAP